MLHVYSTIIVSILHLTLFPHLSFHSLRQPKANLGQTTTHKTLRRREMDRTRLFEHKPKESSNGEPLGVGLQTIYTTIHEGCARLSVGLCTVHDIIAV